MNGFFAAAFVVVAGSLLSTSALAQSASDRYPPYPYGGPLPPVGIEPSPRPTRPRVPREDRVLNLGLLAPTAGDRMAFEAFLRTRNTGLIRLLPREVYDSGTYPVEKKLKIRGGGAYYSFAHLTHAYGYGSDIELDHNRLSVGFAGADYGMLTNIGDTPLEEIALNDIRTRDIAAYRPPRPEAEARQESRRLISGKGLMFDGFLYQRTVPVQKHSTYLLRSISYDNSDVLVAFRLFRQDTDGSVIIAWKLLKRYSAPELKRSN